MRRWASPSQKEVLDPKKVGSLTPHFSNNIVKKKKVTRRPSHLFHVRPIFLCEKKKVRYKTRLLAAAKGAPDSENRLNS